MPYVRDLSQDSSQHVRAALANQISGLAPLLGKESTTEHLLPMFLHLLKDEFPDVRLNIISKLETVNKGKFFKFSLLRQRISNRYLQLSELSSYPRAFCQPLLSLQRINHGAFAKLSLNTFLYSQINSGNHFSTSNLETCVCRGSVTLSIVSEKQRP